MSRIVINDIKTEDTQILFDLTEEESQLVEGGIFGLALAAAILGTALLITFVAGAIKGRP